MTGPLTCPTCGHRVRVVAGDSGSHYFAPIEAEATELDVDRLALRDRLREALDDWLAFHDSRPNCKNERQVVAEARAALAESDR